MKKVIILLLIVGVCSCKKDNKQTNPASLHVSVFQTDNLNGNDSTKAHSANAYIAIWKETVKGEIEVKSPADGEQGNGYDSVANKTVKADYLVTDDDVNIPNIPPGEYLVNVVDNYEFDTAHPYSSTEVNVKAGDKINLIKVFNYTGKNLKSPWGDDGDGN